MIRILYFWPAMLDISGQRSCLLKKQEKNIRMINGRINMQNIVEMKLRYLRRIYSSLMFQCFTNNFCLTSKENPNIFLLEFIRQHLIWEVFFPVFKTFSTAPPHFENFQISKCLIRKIFNPLLSKPFY